MLVDAQGKVEATNLTIEIHGNDASFPAGLCACGLTEEEPRGRHPRGVCAHGAEGCRVVGGNLRALSSQEGVGRRVAKPWTSLWRVWVEIEP